MSMQTAVQEINTDYDAKMEAEKNSVAYDNMEISGGRAVWKDVLAVYAVKTNTDKDNPQEVATMDESKKQILSDIFWEMNSISSRSESHSETEITETDDGNGNIVQTETTVTKTTLYITVSHLTVDEMADLYGFDAEQREYLAELLKDKNNSVKLLELRERLKEYTGFDYSVIPESIVEAFIERIWVSKDEFRWYLRTGNNADSEFDPDGHIKIGAFTLTIDDAKKYIYSFSTRRRVYKWADLNVSVWI